jgi:hypothetical protein
MDDAQVRELQSVNPELAALYYEGSGAIADAPDEEALEEVRVRLLGRKSALTQVLRSIPALPAEQRPVVGRLGNLVRAELEKLADERRDALRRAALSASLAGERIDVTLPGVPFPAGHEHLISQTMREVEDIFIGLGYRIAEGPEVELDYYNFTSSSSSLRMRLPPLPTSGRSSAGRLGMARRNSVSALLRPRIWTRACSSAARSCARRMVSRPLW